MIIYEGKKIKKKKDIGIQPVLNIGMVGHVDHGKTTLLERLSGKWTDTHSEEIKRGITIRLGYADVILRKCSKCKGADSYTTKEKCENCDAETKILKKVSFVDAPGHESLMATMLAGATIMDAALLLVAANEECPQPQTREHLMALQIIGVKNIIIVQNKVDLLDEERSIKNYEQIKSFIKGTLYEDSPIIPISAQHRTGLGFLLEAIDNNFTAMERDSSKPPIMLVARSFDINKPGTKMEILAGGVLGGSLRQGSLKVGDLIEIRPGYEVLQKNQKVYIPLKTTITDLKTGNESVNEVTPGGSIGVMTNLDPSVVKSDKLTGNLVGLPGKLPPVWYSFNLKITLLERVVGVKEDKIVEPVKLGESLMININSAATVGVVIELKKGLTTCKLKLPVCADVGARVTLSRMIGNRFRLIGFGIIES